MHSITAGKTLKEYIRLQFPVIYPFYRLFYNIVSLVTFGLAWYFSPKPGYVIYDLVYPYDIIILFPKTLAAVGILYTFRYFDGMSFLGITQSIRYIRTGNAEIASTEADDFTEKGPYRYSRHPLYLYSILFLVFQPSVTLYYLVLTILAIIYFYAGSYYEERKLENRFGGVYGSYKKKVPRIFPWDYF